MKDFTNPKTNISQLGVKEGDVVADFGSGVGHYVFLLSEAVGENGRVYAVDIQKTLLNKMQKELDEKSVRNVDVIWGDVEKRGGVKIASGALDSIIASNILFQVSDKTGFANECKRTLRPGGRVFIIDWSESFGGIGPRPDSVVTENQAKELFEKVGLTFEKSVLVGIHHYGLIFKK